MGSYYIALFLNILIFLDCNFVICNLNLGFSNACISQSKFTMLRVIIVVGHYTIMSKYYIICAEIIAVYRTRIALFHILISDWDSLMHMALQDLDIAVLLQNHCIMFTQYRSKNIRM